MALLLMSPAPAVLAGGGPLNVAVVVNDNSTDSLALGRYYCDQRGIPEAQMVHVTTATSGVITADTFTNQIYQPLMSSLLAGGLTGQIDTVVYCLGLPHAVSLGTLRNGITAATYYGFKTYTDPSVEQCTLPPETENPYYGAEESFDARDRSGDSVGYVSSLLAALSLEEAKQVVDRSIAADGSMPTGRVYLVHTSDTARNVHWPQFEEADALYRVLPVPATVEILDAEFISGKTDVVGYLMGNERVPNLTNNTYRAGALGDHLTSYGGILTNPGGTGQMEIDDWLRAGCVGSYGTVVEPCNYTNKFPNARLHYYYGRGFSMGESYAMAVANPYMGLVMGDPLCAPYASAPGVVVAGVSPGQTLSGTASISITGTAASVGQVVGQIDLFVDNRYVTTATNVTAGAGDSLSITVNGSARSVVFPDGTTGSDLVQAMADRVNMPPPLPVTAHAVPDRLELVQDQLGARGTGITYSVTAAGSNLTVSAEAANLVEMPYPARQEISLSGTPEPGDSLSLSITPLGGGPIVSHIVSQQAGDGLDDLFIRLQNAVNLDANLQTSAGCIMKYRKLYKNASQVVVAVEAFLVARTNGWEGYNLQADYQVNSNPTSGMEGPDYQGSFSSNEGVMSARGTVFLSMGRSNLVGMVQLDTTTLPDGPHTLRAVAYDGSAVRTQGLSQQVPFVVSNHTLRCSLSTPGDGTAFLVGQDVRWEALATGGAGAVTSVEFFVEGKLDSAVSGAPFTNVFSTTGYGVGAMGIQALAHNDAGESVLSERVEILLLDPTDGDGDGLPDGWELLYFPSTNTTDGTIDSDGDEKNDLAEYIADTDPDDPAHYFEIFDLRVMPTHAEVEFVSSPARNYTVEVNPQCLTNESDWVILPPAATPGSVSSTVRSDPGGGADTNRFYRAKALAP